MKISLILAMDENNGIAIDDQIPWHLPTDLKRFKALTMGHHILMGRKTFQSIGKPLPGRTTIILTHQEGYFPSIPGNYSFRQIKTIENSNLKEHLSDSERHEREIFISDSIDKAFEFSRSRGEDELFVVGGGEIYEQTLPLADHIYLTRVHDNFNCSTFAPDIEISDWEEIERIFFPSNQLNPFPTTFIRMRRIHKNFKTIKA